MRGKIVAYSGAHGVGKTTAARAEYRYRKSISLWRAVGYLGEVARKCPHKTGRASTRESQSWLFAAQWIAEASAVRKKPLTVADRCIFDPIAYSLALGYASQAEAMLALCDSVWEVYGAPYDAIYWIRADRGAAVPDDGFRDTDVAFRNRVDDAFAAIFAGRPYVIEVTEAR
jgi:thymidylate kinase